jgi:hypothetical protein
MQTPTGILVEMKGDGSLGREEPCMAALAEQMGIPASRASEKQVEGGKYRLAPGMVPVGSVPFVKHAMRQFGKALPEHTPYPVALDYLLHHNVRKLRSLADARELLANGQKLFIKPADGWKRFTGFVAEFGDHYRFNGASRSKPVWVELKSNLVYGGVEAGS